jgi:undecaprenyl pyrophosphate synthase
MPSRPGNAQPAARHVALIADGNRRWAHARGLPVSAGYEAGADTLKARLADAIYLLWQAAYSELVFRDEMWPDFSRAAFEGSLTRFNTRSRRFGGRQPTLRRPRPPRERIISPCDALQQ